MQTASRQGGATPPTVNVRASADTRPPAPGGAKSFVLDAIDRRIIAALQENGRITNLDLSKRVGLSPPPCLRRVRALTDAGVIRGFHADVDPEKLGWNLIVFAVVELESQQQQVLAAFETLVRSWQEVRECYMIRGGGDFLLRLVARDNAHGNELTQNLTRAPAVNRVQTLQIIQVSTSLPGVPVL
jgi:DNA-binding Lrp family transcriptional regulator